MSKYVTEILHELNTEPNSARLYKDNSAIKFVFEYAYDPAKKMVLPEGDPPFKEDAAPIGMSPANLMMELKKLYVFCRTDLQALRRETLFVQLLENVHPTEAKLLLAIKDQNLTSLYENLTHQFAYDNGFITVEPEVKEEVKKPKKVKKNSVPVGQVD